MYNLDLLPMRASRLLKDPCHVLPSPVPGLGVNCWQRAAANTA